MSATPPSYGRLASDRRPGVTGPAPAPRPPLPSTSEPPRSRPARRLPRPITGSWPPCCEPEPLMPTIRNPVPLASSPYADRTVQPGAEQSRGRRGAQAPGCRKGDVSTDGRVVVLVLVVVTASGRMSVLPGTSQRGQLRAPSATTSTDRSGMGICQRVGAPSRDPDKTPARG